MCMFDSPSYDYTSTTEVEAPEQAPTEASSEVQDARQSEEDRARAASGLSSTILTGGSGLTTSASTTYKTLLGL